MNFDVNERMKKPNKRVDLEASNAAPLRSAPNLRRSCGAFGQFTTDKTDYQ